MAEENINIETIDKLDKELNDQEAAVINKKVDDVKNEYELKLSDLEKKIEELTPKPVDPQEALQKELDDQKATISKMKADFERQIDSISLRKSVPNNDQSQQEETQKPYTELSDAEKNEEDIKFFIKKGIF